MKIQTSVNFLVTKFNLVMPVFQALLDAIHITKQSFSCRHYQARVGCISEASYTFLNLNTLVHDIALMHPTLALQDLRQWKIAGGLR